MLKIGLYEDENQKVEIDYDIIRFFEILKEGSFYIPKKIFSKCLMEEISFLNEMKEDGIISYPQKLKTSQKAIYIHEDFQFIDEFQTLQQVVDKLIERGYHISTPEQREELWNEDQDTFENEYILDCTLIKCGNKGAGIDFCISALDSNKENLIIVYLTFGDFIKDIFQ